MGISNLFNISRTSLFTYQRALSIVSDNIANANNPNYSRRLVVLGTERPDYRANFTFGAGVKLDHVLRVSNEITERQIRNANQNFYSAQKEAQVLSQVESLYSEPSDYGLSNLINKFFESWDDLSVDPTSSPLRTSVIQAAQQLSEKIQNIHDDLTQIQSDMRADAQNMVSKINTITEQIHMLNKQIYEASVVGYSPNDLLDKRDALLNELSQIANINVNIDKNNVANVSIGGVFAVDGLHRVEFKLAQEDGKLKVQTKDGAATVSLRGGELKAVTDIFAEKVPKYLESLDALTQKIYDSVNNVHKKGYTNTNPPQDGILFFTSYENGELKINEKILENPSMIAVSKDGTNGNNEIALEIAGLRNVTYEDGLTISENYSNYISEIANDIQVSSQDADSYNLVLAQLEQQKMQYSGVSTDEEMVNVLKYQKSYDAAAKLITLADDLLETLINLV